MKTTTMPALLLLLLPSPLLAAQPPPMKLSRLILTVPLILVAMWVTALASADQYSPG